jgi:hypothetical protein
LEKIFYSALKHSCFTQLLVVEFEKKIEDSCSTLLLKIMKLAKSLRIIQLQTIVHRFATQLTIAT